MTVIQPHYFYREYSHDIPHPSNEDSSPLDLSKRVALAALPFISLYKPLSYTLSCGLGILRSVTTISQLWESFKNNDSLDAKQYYALQAAISTLALAGTLFAHPLGMLITTCDDLRIEVMTIAQHLAQNEHKELFESCLKIANNSLYLAMFLTGGLHIGIASLSLQLFIGLYHSHKEFQQGRWLEGAGHLGMALVRSHQLAFQIKQLSPHILPIPKAASQTVNSSSTLQPERQCLIQNEIENRPDLSELPKETLYNLLMEKGYDPHKITNAGNNILHQAVKNNDLEAVKLGLAYQIDPMDPNRMGDTPLHLAADKGLLPICTYLIEHKASITQPNFQSQTPFHKALKNNHTEILNLFERLGYQRSDPFSDQLLSFGYSPHSLDAQGNTLVHRAVLDNNQEVLHLLIEKGYAIDAINNKGMTPFMLATLKADIPSMRYLYDQGADINLSNHNQDTALHIASKNKKPLVVKFLLNLPNIDIHVGHQRLYTHFGNSGITPLHYAVANEDIYAIQYLLEAGVNANACICYSFRYRALWDQKKYNGYHTHSALDLIKCINPNNQNVLNLLMQYGAKDARDLGASLFYWDHSDPENRQLAIKALKH